MNTSSNLSKKELMLLTKYPSFTVVSDFWGYLEFKVNESNSDILDKINRDFKNNDEKLEHSQAASLNWMLAKSFLNQAKSFHTSAESSTAWESVPLLRYYSFLNYVKVLRYLSIAKENNALNYLISLKVPYDHGLKEVTDNSSTKSPRELLTDNLHILKYTTKSAFALLRDMIGATSVSRGDIQIPITRILKSCPFLFQAAKTADYKWDSYFQTSKNFRDDLELNNSSGMIVRKQHIDAKGDKIPDSEIIKLSSVTAFSCILTPDGTRAYIGTKSEALNHMLAIYLFMFYLGSICRYRPYIFEHPDLRAKDQWLIKEFLSYAPYQFLYQTLAMVTNVGIQLPNSKIIV